MSRLRPSSLKEQIKKKNLCLSRKVYKIISNHEIELKQTEQLLQGYPVFEM